MQLETFNHKNYKNNFHSSNEQRQQSITLRANYTISKKISINISIGLLIADLLDMNNKDRINIYLHKKNKDHILIKKCDEDIYGHTLVTAGNFLVCHFVHDFHSDFKIKQTIISNWDINQDNNLLIDISKLKWKT